MSLDRKQQRHIDAQLLWIIRPDDVRREACAFGKLDDRNGGRRP
jgi:hypothetical protein